MAPMRTPGCHSCGSTLVRDAGPAADAAAGAAKSTLLTNADADASAGDGDLRRPDARVTSQDAAEAAVDAGNTISSPGARCVYQDATIPCVMTDQGGVFTLKGLPPLTNIVISVAKDGYRSVLRPIETASTNMDGTANPIALVSNAMDDPPFPVKIDWVNQGQLTFFAIAPLPDAGLSSCAHPDANVSISPAAGSCPFFAHDDVTWYLDAKTFVGVAGEYVNLDPGNYQLTFDDPVHACAPISTPFGQFGFPAPPTSVKFPVVAGYTTGPVGIFCTNRSVLADAGR
jgi:hypothetical protein